MNITDKPVFRGGEDEDYCGAFLIYAEDRSKEESEDYILPDYLPDVKKIVAVFPETVIKGRFLGSGTLEYDGETRYKVLYIAEDGKLRSVTFLDGFEDKIGSEDLSDDCVEILTPVCRGLNVRLINPRKLNVRAQNGAIVEVYKRKCILPELQGAVSADDAERLIPKVGEAQGMNILTLCESGLSLSEDLSFDPSTPSAEEMLCAGVTLTAEDCRLSAGEAQIKGCARCVVFCQSLPDASGKRELIKLQKDLPFTQTVKNKGLHADGVCSAELQPESSEFRLREDESGQKRTLEADVSYKCCLTVCYPKKLKKVTDAFSLEKETETDGSVKTVYAPLCAHKGSFSVNETVELDLPDDGSYTLEYCFARPELTVLPIEDGKLTLGGNCFLTALLRDGAGDLDVRRASVPLRFRTDQTADGEVVTRLCTRASGERFRLDKNKLSFDGEIGFFGFSCAGREARTTDTIRILPGKRSLPGRRGSLIFVYKDENEDLFDVAKKYGVPPESVEEQAQSGARPIYIERK